MRDEMTVRRTRTIRSLALRLSAAVLLLFEAAVAQDSDIERQSISPMADRSCWRRDEGGTWRIDGVPAEAGDRYQEPGWGRLRSRAGKRGLGVWWRFAISSRSRSTRMENSFSRPVSSSSRPMSLKFWPARAPGFTGTAAPPPGQHCMRPRGLALDASGNVIVADWGSNRIRIVDTETGSIETLAGSGVNRGYGGDGGPATEASLNRPTHLAVDSTGRVYATDSGNGRIRVVDPVTGSDRDPRRVR